MMKKAKTYKGIKVMIDLKDDYLNSQKAGLLNVPYSTVEEFYKAQNGKHSYVDDNLEDIKLVEGNLTLYKILTCFPDGDITVLINFRRGFNYKNARFETKKGIEQLLKDGYVIAVAGLGEIDSIEDIK